MHDIFNDISTWSILKWVIIVLVAGFIGQFGKSMAQTVMTKIHFIRAKKQEAPGTDKTQATIPEKENSHPDQIMDNSRLPLNSNPIITTTVQAQDKKTLKNLAKKEKKATKLTKKAG